MADILVVKENRLGGHDIFLTDLHGTASRLKRFLKKRMGPSDRLFIAGDLLDKGPDSFGVFKLLQDPQYKERIFIVRGNHEQMCLDAIKSLEFLACSYFDTNLTELVFDVRSVIERIGKIKKAGDIESATAAILGKDSLDLSQAFDRDMLQHISNLHLYLINAGKWMIDKYLLELTANKIKVMEVTNNEGKIPARGVQYNKPNSEQNSEISQLKEFINELPVIIVKAGPNPFVMAHATVPISDKELLEDKINRGDLSLSPPQIYSALWTRVKDSDVDIEVIRDANSMLAVVGHTPTLIPGVSAVRLKSNTVNGDIAAFITDNYLILNMTTGKAEYFKSTKDKLLLKICGEVHDHLQSQIKRGLVLRAAPEVADGAYQLVLMEDTPEAKKQVEKAPEQKALQAFQNVGSQAQSFRVAPLNSEAVVAENQPIVSEGLFGKKAPVKTGVELKTGRSLFKKI